MPLRSKHSARIRDPAGFRRFRRTNNHFGQGIHVVWGITPGGETRVQAIRFEAARYSVREAKAWLRRHGYRYLRFEPAARDREEGRMNEEFLLIEAQTGDEVNPTVMGMAYSGGKMKLPGWRHPVVVDLAGLTIPESVPLLTNHENRTASRIGAVTAAVEDGTLVIEGKILSTNGQARGILEQAKAANQALAGADWQLSIGAEVRDAELVPRGRHREVNGQSHAGPFYHIRAAVLREVSVVAVGADASTRMKVAAAFTLYAESELLQSLAEPKTDLHTHLSQGEPQMNEFEKWLEKQGIAAGSVSGERLETLRARFEKEKESGKGDEDETRVVPAPEPQKKPEADPAPKAPEQEPATPAPDAKEEARSAVREERERVSAIQELCAGEFAEVEREAIRAGWSVEETSRKVLVALRENRPQADIAISVAREVNPGEAASVLEAALCLRAGLREEDLAADYGDRVVASATPDRNISMQELIVECARIEGKSIPRTFGNDSIRAGFSTVSLPGILNNVANKRLLKSFRAQPIIATRLCSEGDLDDFKESQRFRLTDVGDLEAISADGELKHGRLHEEKATNQLDTFGKTFSLTRKMIINDDLNSFMKVPEGMGARAARKVDQLFFMRLLSNPGNLFSTAHKNYKAGADSALSGDSLALALQMFLDQVDADKQPINVPPKYLLVPTALKMTARELLHSIVYTAVGATDKRRIPTYNAIADEDLEVISSPYLANTQYAGASQKAWYLFADPTVVDTFEIGYLKGRRVPTVERGETDFNTLGMQFRVYFDLGVREQDHRGLLKFKGEA